MRYPTAPTFALLMLALAPAIASAQWAQEPECKDNWRNTGVRHCWTTTPGADAAGHNAANLTYRCGNDGWETLMMYFETRHGHASDAPALSLPIKWGEAAPTQHPVETRVVQSRNGTNLRYYYYMTPEAAMPATLDAVLRNDTVSIEMPFTRVPREMVTFTLAGARPAILATQTSCLCGLAAGQRFHAENAGDAASASSTAIPPPECLE